MWTVHRLGGGDIYIVLGTIVLGSNTFCFLMLVIMFVAKRDILALENDGFWRPSTLIMKQNLKYWAG